MGWRRPTAGRAEPAISGVSRATSGLVVDKTRPESAMTGRWRICHKAACQALWVYASIQYFDVPLFTIF
jgi:hypothetical protein